MVLEKSTIKPGLLVSLKTVLQGNVSYTKTTIEEEHEDDGGGTEEKWETLKTVENKAEHEVAVKIRGMCRSVVTAVCAKSSFGLLCPLDKQDKLEEAIAEARGIAEKFNAQSTLSKIKIFVLVGTLINDEIEAAKAINFEIRGLIDSMEEGIKKLDVDKIREAAAKAVNMRTMLSDEASSQLKTAISISRKAARQIVKSGEVAVGEIDKATLERLNEARAAFLDITETEVPESDQGEAPVLDLDFSDLDESPLVEQEESAEEIAEQLRQVQREPESDKVGKAVPVETTIDNEPSLAKALGVKIPTIDLDD